MNGREERVVFVCDAGPLIGVGHVMRSLGLAEELSARSIQVEFLADLDEVPWAKAEVTGRDFTVRPRGDEAQLLRRLSALEATRVVFDGYSLSPHVLTEARRYWRTLTMVDGSAGTPVGDVVVDQNLGAESFGHQVPGELLAGCRYSLARDDVRVMRREDAPTGELLGGIPQVLVVMGGTDAYGLTPAVLRALSQTGVRCSVTAISARPASDILPKDAGSELSLRVVSPGPDFAQLVSRADLVVTASGSSVWDIFLLGTCAALVQVVENQTLGYEASVGRGLAAGLGTGEHLRTPEGLASASERLKDLLTSPAERRRHARAAWGEFDGLGRARIAERLIRQIR